MASHKQQNAWHSYFLNVIHKIGQTLSWCEQSCVTGTNGVQMCFSCYSTFEKIRSSSRYLVTWPSLAEAVGEALKLDCVAVLLLNQHYIPALCLVHVYMVSLLNKMDQDPVSGPEDNWHGMPWISMSKSSFCSPEQEKHLSAPHWQQPLPCAIPQSMSCTSLGECWLARARSTPRTG